MSAWDSGPHVRVGDLIMTDSECAGIIVRFYDNSLWEPAQRADRYVCYPSGVVMSDGWMRTPPRVIAR